MAAARAMRAERRARVKPLPSPSPSPSETGAPMAQRGFCAATLWRARAPVPARAKPRVRLCGQPYEPMHACVCACMRLCMHASVRALRLHILEFSQASV
eukprot:6016660-Pleurochrysis_carterae.AAC.2